MTRRLLACAIIVGTIAFQPFVNAGAFERPDAPAIAEALPLAVATSAPIESPDTDAPPGDELAAASTAAPTAAPSAEPTAEPTAAGNQVPGGGDRSAVPPTAVEVPTADPSRRENARPADKAGYLYSYAVDESRYNDIATSIDAYKPFGNPSSGIRPYVAALLTRDTRTGSQASADGGPPLPLILADNYALGALGVQFTTAGGLRVFGQVGRSFTVGPVAAQPSGNDARGGVQLYREWGPAFVPGHDYGNFYGSVEYLSRYSDTISYDQLELVRNANTAKLPVEIFGRVVTTLDTRQHYYSNVLELTAGIRVHPFGIHGPIVSVEQTGGTYLRGQLPSGVKHDYLDFRPTISYGFNI